MGVCASQRKAYFPDNLANFKDIKIFFRTDIYHPKDRLLRLYDSKYKTEG